MTKNNLIKRAFLNALGVVAYVALFAVCVNSFQQIGPDKPDKFVPLGMILFLIAFIVSASVTGFLVLGKPAMLYHDGMKREGMHMFAYTVGFLAVMALLMIFVLSAPSQTNQMSNPFPVQNPSPNPLPVTEQRCGGNMMNAPTCSPGFHCAPVPGSHLPFGDVGGICVAD